MIMMALSLVLVLVAVVLTVRLRDVPQRDVASVREMATKSSTGPLIRGEIPVKPWREKTRPLPAPEVSKDDANPAPSGAEPKPRSAPAAEAGEASHPEPNPRPRAPIVGESAWSRPTQGEIEAANGPRHYDMPAGAIMSLTIDSIGIYGAPVFDSAGQRALANGVAHLPDTSFPWSPTPQRNVYLAGHRMGYRGTWSRMIFYNLNKLGEGDKVVLRDRTGRTYEYRVSETFVVDPSDYWVTGRMRGRDMLTLQTCTPIPTFEKRLIVRAYRP